MMQYFQRRPMLFRFLDIPELTCLTLVVGSPLLQKCVDSPAVGSPKQQKLQQKRKKEKFRTRITKISL